MIPLEAIERRRSVRNFKDERISTADLDQIQTAFTAPMRGPFGNSMRGRLLYSTAKDPDALNGLDGANVWFH